MVPLLGGGGGAAVGDCSSRGLGGTVAPSGGALRGGLGVLVLLGREGTTPGPAERQSETAPAADPECTQSYPTRQGHPPCDAVIAHPFASSQEIVKLSGRFLDTSHICNSFSQPVEGTDVVAKFLFSAEDEQTGRWVTSVEYFTKVCLPRSVCPPFHWMDSALGTWENGLRRGGGGRDALGGRGLRGG